MSIQKYSIPLDRTLSGIGTLALLSLLSLLSTGCNQDGVGIFYSISQEEKQITSRISEVNVYQVVEVGAGPETYALGGRTVWRQSGDNWNSIGGGYAYNIVENSGDLYAYFNNDDDNLDEGRIKRFDGTTWTTVDSFSDDGNLIDIGSSTYSLSLNGGSLHIDSNLTNLSASSGGTATITGGTYLSGNTTHYLISKSSVYSSDGLTLDDPALTFTSSTDKNGDFAAITSNGTDTLYLVTTSGQVFSSIDGSNWTYLNSVGESVDADFGAASIVTIGVTDYLMIGTSDGHYQMELSGGYTFTETPDDYAASYPELASAMVYQVYQGPTSGEIFLATENGLWKRTGPAAYERQ